MEIATSLLPRIVRLALIGAATAFAWVVLTLLLGLGLSQAHADQTDDGGLLGGALHSVTSAADATAATATEAISTATTGAAAVADTVIASAPAPVQEPVSQVVHSVGAVATSVTEPVSDAVSGGVAGGVTQPVVDIVAEVPVVGDVVTAVGLDDAVTDLAGTADETLGGLVDAIDEAGATVGRPPIGATPAIPASPLLPALPGLTGSLELNAQDPAVDGTALLRSADASAIAAAAVRVAWAAASVSAAVAADLVLISPATLVANGPSGFAGALCLPSASAGPCGGGLGAWALVALVPLAAHRAWVRRAGPEDDHAPPAPAGSTDVSPD